MPPRYMLDTNTVSYLIKGLYPPIAKKLLKTPLDEICISAITEAELYFGLAKKPAAFQLRKVVNEFLLRVERLPWDSIAADAYGRLRYQLEKTGKTLGSLDLLIAAHAIATKTTLVTHDQAFHQLKNILKTEDWSLT